MFKIYRFTGAEIVAGANDVGAVRVGEWVEVCKKGEHLRRMASATKDDEKVGWGASFPWKGAFWVDSGEDIEKAELKFYRRISQQLEPVDGCGRRGTNEKNCAYDESKGEGVKWVHHSRISLKWKITVGLINGWRPRLWTNQ